MNEIAGRKLLALTMACTLAIYLLGIGGSFVFDDGTAILYNTTLQVDEWSLDAALQAMQSSYAGLLQRPISMLTLWINYNLSGLDARDYKLTNILIHLINGLLLFQLSRAILRAHHLSRTGREIDEEHERIIALFATALWLLHPLNLTSVLYVVQRMASLSTLFMLAAALSYTSARLRMMRGNPAMGRLTAGFLAFGALAVLSKENGALLPLYLLALEATLFRFTAAKPLHRKQIIAFFVVVIAVPAVAAIPWLWNSDLIVADRLLTQSRVLWLYVKWIFVPDLTELALYHDDFAVSRTLTDPWTTAASCGGIALMVVAAALSARRAPMFAFAVAWFLAGHSMESTVIPLQMIHEHRNYMPIAGVLLAAATGLCSTGAVMPKRVGLALAAIWVIAMAAVTGIRSHQWGDPVTLALKEVEHHPQSAKANFEAALKLLQLDALAAAGPESQRPDRSRIFQLLQRSVELDSATVATYPMLLTAAQHFQLPAQDQWLVEMRERLATQKTVVVQPMAALVEGQIKGTQQALKKEQVTELFTAALENPRITRIEKSQLLALLGRYFAGMFGDYQQAVQLTMAATEYAPGWVPNQITLAKWGIALGNPQVAREAIERARSLDQSRQYAHQLQELTAAVESMQN